jgi:hypothetical protein
MQGCNELVRGHGMRHLWIIPLLLRVIQSKTETQFRKLSRQCTRQKNSKLQAVSCTNPLSTPRRKNCLRNIRITQVTLPICMRPLTVQYRCYATLSWISESSPVEPGRGWTAGSFLGRRILLVSSLVAK